MIFSSIFTFSEKPLTYGNLLVSSLNLTSRARFEINGGDSLTAHAAYKNWQGTPKSLIEILTSWYTGRVSRHLRKIKRGESLGCGQYLASTDITSSLGAAIPRHRDTQITRTPPPLLACDKTEWARSFSLACEQALHLWRAKPAMKPQRAEKLAHLFLRESPYICDETKEEMVIKWRQVLFCNKFLYYHEHDQINCGIMRKTRSDGAGFKLRKIIIFVFLMLRNNNLRWHFIEGHEARFSKVP